jgi:hypothetical protein
MHYSDFLDLPTQLSLIILVVVLSAGFLMRAGIFFRLESAGLRPLFPDSWNAAQCRALERFRLLIGLTLIPLWAVYLFIVLSTPTSRSYGYLEVISLISMLAISYAWAVLLAVRNLKGLDAFPRSFVLITAFLVLWWGTAFSAIGWLLAEASMPPPVHTFSTSVYAEREMPRLIRSQNAQSRQAEYDRLPASPWSPDGEIVRCNNAIWILEHRQRTRALS